MPAQHPRLTITGPLLRGSGDLHIVGRDDDVVTIADPLGAMQRLLGLADGSRSRDEIALALTGEFAGLGEREVHDALDELERGGLIEDRPPPAAILAGHASWHGRRLAA